MRLRDTFARRDLDRLLGEAGPALLSIMMPTHRSGPEIRQDPIRFKNLLDHAELQFEEHRDAPDAQLSQVRGLLQDQTFWRHQSDALMMFLGGDEPWCFRAPVRVEELLVVASRFHVLPLLTLVDGGERFYLLAVSQDEVRLLSCTRQHYTPVQLDLPSGRQSIQQFVDGEKDLQHHVAGAAGAAGSRQVTFHGHSGYKDQGKVRLFEYFRAIDQAMDRHLRGDRTPVIFAGVDYLFPIFRAAARSMNLMLTHLTGNFDAGRVSDGDLHRHVLETLAPRFEQKRRETLAPLVEAEGSGRTSAVVEEILPAAAQGRVARLYVDTTRHVWGRFDGKTVERLDVPRPGGEDLLNHGAVLTTEHGGLVHVIERGELPNDAAMAAVYRY